MTYPEGPFQDETSIKWKFAGNLLHLRFEDRFPLATPAKRIVELFKGDYGHIKTTGEFLILPKKVTCPTYFVHNPDGKYSLTTLPQQTFTIYWALATRDYYQDVLWRAYDNNELDKIVMGVLTKDDSQFFIGNIMGYSR